MELEKRKIIDLLIEQFWKQGYMTISRRFGTYLPEPEKLGEFDVDIVARFKKDYAIGITLTSEDFKDSKLLTKLQFLANRQTKFTRRQVMLFIGVPEEHFKTARLLTESLDEVSRKNIRLFKIKERSVVSHRKKEIALFS